MIKLKVDTIEEIEIKKTQVQIKIQEYKTQQLNQLQNGGPGPVADYEIMKIVNEHNSEFEVEVKEENSIE